MADLFGTPVGTLASDQNIRQNMLAAVSAQKTLGDIAQQPAELAMKTAQARLYGAEAGIQEEALKTKEQEQRLMAEFAAREKLVGAAKAQGRDATVADLPPDGSLATSSPVARLQAYADFLDEKGAPLSMTLPLRTKLADITEKTAIGSYRSAQAEEARIKAQKERITQIGQTAAAAALSPQHYMAVRSDPQLSALLPKGLTGDYATDKPVLEAISTAGQDTLKRMDFERKQADDKGKAARRTAGIARDYAAAVAANVRKDLSEEYLYQVRKNDGERSGSAKSAKDSATQAREAVRQAKLRKEFPPVPLDPAARVFGQSYTAADGKTRFVWDKDPISGKGVARRITVDTSAAMAAAKSAAEAPGGSGSSGDGEDE